MVAPTTEEITSEITTRLHVRVKDAADADVAIDPRNHKRSKAYPTSFRIANNAVVGYIKLLPDRAVAPVLKFHHLLNQALANGHLRRVGGRRSGDEGNLEHIIVAVSHHIAVGEIDQVGITILT